MDDPLHHTVQLPMHYVLNDYAILLQLHGSPTDVDPAEHALANQKEERRNRKCEVTLNSDVVVQKHCKCKIVMQCLCSIEANIMNVTYKGRSLQ